MAEYLASPLCMKLQMQMQRSLVKEKGFVPWNSDLKKVQSRNYPYGSYKKVPCPTWGMCELTAPGFSNVKVGPFSEASLKCACLGYLEISNDNMGRKTSTASGSGKKNDDAENSGYTLNAVKRKLSDSLQAFEVGGDLGDRVLQCEGYTAKRPLSLNAVADGPRLRLLWASFLRIEEEVINISNYGISNLDDCLTNFSDVIRKSCQPVCMSWLETELHLLNREPTKAFVTLMERKLNGDNTVLQSIRNSGKEGCCYDRSLFKKHGVSILEDLVISLADGIVSIYLELISVDSNFSDETDNLPLTLCTLSTRALQRLRNEVALYQWLYQNLEAVASMYEDRFDLRTFQSQLVKESDDSWTGNYSWWKWLTRKSTDTASSTLLTREA